MKYLRVFVTILFVGILFGTATSYADSKELSCCFKVEVKRSLLSVKADIQELCGQDHANVPYKMHVYWGEVGDVIGNIFPKLRRPSGKEVNGTISGISGGGSTSIDTNTPVVLGKIEIEITVDGCEPVKVKR